MTTSTTEEDLGKLILGWADAWSSHDKERLLALYTDDCVYEDLPLHLVSHGKEGLVGFAEFTLAAAEGFAIELKHYVVGGNRGAAEWIMSGTLRQPMAGPLQVGAPFAIRGASIITFDGTKIKHQTDFWDSATAADPIEP
jgi:steroid delta-isomerase-like uncharacterized protein